jgi:thioredoxin reductase (NADPH)
VSEHDVLVVGGGIAGRVAATFTARAGLDTAVFDTDESILRRNAHLENFPGFPAGINPRLLLDLTREQAERVGVTWHTREVVDVDEHPEGGFVIKTDDEDQWAYRGDRLVAGTPGNLGYLDHLPVETFERDGSRFVDATPAGRTNVDGVYAAGRLAGKPLQAVIAAGHGAEVGVAVLEDADVPFAFDWSVPDGYFTDRGVDAPPGVEEVSTDERLAREQRSLEAMQEHFATPHAEEPDRHPDLRTGDGK